MTTGFVLPIGPFTLLNTASYPINHPWFWRAEQLFSSWQPLVFFQVGHIFLGVESQAFPRHPHNFTKQGRPWKVHEMWLLHLSFWGSSSRSEGWTSSLWQEVVSVWYFYFQKRRVIMRFSIVDPPIFRIFLIFGLRSHLAALGRSLGGSSPPSKRVIARGRRWATSGVFRADPLSQNELPKESAWNIFAVSIDWQLHTEINTRSKSSRYTSLIMR